MISSTSATGDEADAEGRGERGGIEAADDEEDEDGAIEDDTEVEDDGADDVAVTDGEAGGTNFSCPKLTMAGGRLG